MKKMFVRAGMAGAIAAAALAVPASAGASMGPANTLDGCAVGGPEGTTCTWTADVSGSYAVGGNGTYLVEQQTGTDTSGNPIWSTVASGSGPAAGSPGSLAKGGTYRLTVSGNEGGALGSVTGQNGAV
jgi:hypothetical protein